MYIIWYLSQNAKDCQRWHVPPNLSAVLENWCYIGVRRHTSFTCERLFAISLENISPESFYESEFFLFKIPKIPKCEFYILYAILKSGMVAANCRLFTNKYLSEHGDGDLQVGALKFFPLPLLMPERLKKTALLRWKSCMARGAENHKRRMYSQRFMQSRSSQLYQVNCTTSITL